MESLASFQTELSTVKREAQHIQCRVELFTTSVKVAWSMYISMSIFFLTFYLDYLEKRYTLKRTVPIKLVITKKKKK